jgi:hypothetical protein
MSNTVHVQSARPLTQAARLARKEFLRNDVAKLERQLREVNDQITRLLEGCEHTDANGRSAVIGGRTKVCAHCGRIVARGDKLWG